MGSHFSIIILSGVIYLAYTHIPGLIELDNPKQYLLVFAAVAAMGVFLLGYLLISQ